MRKYEGRTVGLYTKVSPEEKEVIDRKMALLGTMNLRAYLRKMAVDGYVVQLDMSSVVELVKLLRSISSNVNQIARRCNSTNNLYAQDVEDLRQGYTEVWQGIMFEGYPQRVSVYDGLQDAEEKDLLDDAGNRVEGRIVYQRI